jgi:hypothetical protein
VLVSGQVKLFIAVCEAGIVLICIMSCDHMYEKFCGPGQLQLLAV